MGCPVTATNLDRTLRWRFALHRIYDTSYKFRGVASIRDVRTRLLTPENVAITVAIVFSVAGAYTIQLRVSAGVAAFFGLLGTRFASAVVRTGAACTATFVTYVGLLVIVSGRDGSLFDAAVAFSLTALAGEAAARTLD